MRLVWRHWALKGAASPRALLHVGVRGGRDTPGGRDSFGGGGAPALLGHEPTDAPWAGMEVAHSSWG